MQTLRHAYDPRPPDTPWKGSREAGTAVSRGGEAQPQRIAFFGNFGAENLGNECTLAAMVENVRRWLPDGELTSICAGPEDVAARHGISASLISYRQSREFREKPFSWGGRRSPRRMLRRLFVRLPREIVEVVRAYRKLKDITLLVMTGTGMLSDIGIGPLDLHYEILKWTVLARLRGAKVAFVSVGAGPIASPLGRWIVKRALSLAHYRSYRDAFSRRYLQQIGFDSSSDPVYPDLAFSLPPRARSTRGAPGRVVSVGLMDYYGTSSSPRAGEAAYLAYLDKMAGFAAWLIGRGYQVHLLIGDLAYDTRCKADVLRRLRESGAPTRDGQVVDVSIASSQQLAEQLAASDLVVATRFHAVVLSLMAGKPTLALSYHAKLASLMEAMDLAPFCHDVDRDDLSQLVRQFTALEQAAPRIRTATEEKVEACRSALDEQYRRIFQGAGAQVHCSQPLPP